MITTREAKKARSTGGRKGPKTPEGQAKSLQNLEQYQQPTQRAPDHHGAYEIALLQPQTRQVMETLQGILQGEAAAFIRPADQITIGLFSVCLRRINQCELYLDKVGGLTNKKGEVRPVVDLLVKLLKEARSYCETLGLTPAARAKLGVDVARTFDLAAAFTQEEVKHDDTKQDCSLEK